MKYINLSNIKINNSKIELEFLYKDLEIDDDIVIYLEDENQKKYFCEVTKGISKVNYSYNNENVEVAKVVINFKITTFGLLKIKLEDKKGIVELKIVNNKNEEISTTQNPYIIFSKTNKIQVLEDGIKIDKIYFGDKIKYEFNKQVYGLKKYQKIFIYRFFKAKKSKFYLFNDRLLYGDDNAEELFKYINKNHPKFAKKCYFVLDKESKSINRIRKIGKVLKYKSISHKIKFLNSRIVISSHSSYLGNCFNPFDKEEMEIYKDIINKKFVFLQHGICMNDVRQYLNRELTTADLFVTSTKQEQEYITSKDFMYEPNMVIDAGLPRFDKLEDKREKVILISPTWRVLDENVKIEDTEYFSTFKSLLSNEYLNEILLEKNYKIKFLLHPVFAKSKYLFDSLANEQIEILESSEIKYFNLFNECSVFITDYSSIHFDVAYLKKPIIYYQFDKEYFFKNHYNSGYFDYEKDGFGKVIANEKMLIKEIEYYLNNDCKTRDEYKNKIEDTFIHIDHNNSKRVYDEIIKLDNNGDINYRFNNVH